MVVRDAPHAGQPESPEALQIERDKCPKSQCLGAIPIRAAAKISTRGRTAPGVHRFRSRSASRAGRVHSQAGCGHIAARSEEMTKLHEQRRERTRSTFREFDE